MPHTAPYIKDKEDLSSAENCEVFCLILEKFLKMAAVLLFATNWESGCEWCLRSFSSPVSYNFYYPLQVISQFHLGFSFKKTHTVVVIQMKNKAF